MTVLFSPAGSKDLMAGSLDIHIASLSDVLIAGMSFANRATASYITGRKSTSFPTQSKGHVRLAQRAHHALQYGGF